MNLVTASCTWQRRPSPVTAAGTPKALQSVAVGLLDQRVRDCVAHADPANADGMTTEATGAIERLLKA